MVEFVFNGVTYNTLDLTGKGSDPSKRYSSLVTTGTGQANVPLYIAMLVDGIADLSNGFITTSTTSNSVGTGSKTFTMASAIPYQVGSYAYVTRTSDPTVTNMYGQITARTSTTLTINVTEVNGSGTYTDWTIAPAGVKGSTGATGSISTMADGSAASPTLTFTSDPDTGVYRIGTNEIGFTCGGTLRASLSASAMTLAVPLALGGNNVTNGTLKTVTDYHDYLIAGDVANGTYVWYYNAQYAHTLTDLIGETSAGTCSVSLRINGVETATLSASTVSSNDNTFGDATISVGDDVTVVVTSASGAQNLFLQLKHTRDLLVGS